LSGSLTARITEQVQNQLPQILPEEVSKMLQGDVSTITYTNSLTKTKAAQYDLLGIEDMVPNIWVPVKVAYDKLALWGISHWREQRKSFYGPQTTISSIRKRDPYTPYQDPQGFIYVDNNGRNRLMRSNELYKFSDKTLTGLQTSLVDITNNIRIEYLPKRRWSTLEKKRANIMIKAIDKQLKERRFMRILESLLVEGTTELTSGYFDKQYDFVILCLSS
ncbi:hypothetical protein Tco_1489863, partial [Tanacetum coccineum]